MVTFAQMGAKMGANPVPNVLTVNEVAELMRVSRMTVYRLIHSGELPAVRAGKSFRIPSSAVKDLLDLTWADDKQSDVSG